MDTQEQNTEMEMETEQLEHMQSTMMDVPLTLGYVLERVGKYFGDGEVVSMIPAGLDELGKPIPHIHRYTYAQMYLRARQLALALQAAGIVPGDRVATLGTNHFRHLEAYFGVPIMGAVLHTLNVRLHPEQLIYIINHARDRILLIDNVMARLLPAILPHCPTLEKVIVMGPLPQAVPGVLDYDQWISGHASENFVYPELDERAPLGMCYTSGTTGNPKGVVYSHRSTVLHSLALVLPSSFDIGVTDRVLPVVPMFHVMAWSLPWAVPMVGASLVLASVFSDGLSLARLMQDERVSIAAGVPTLWLGLAAEIERARGEGTPYRFANLRLTVGGAAAPEAMIRAYDRMGIPITHAWGMTETSPFGTASRVPPGIDPHSDEGYALRAKQGRVPPMVDVEVVDEQNVRIPHDGKTMGKLLIRGQWISQGYYRDEEASQKCRVVLEGPFGKETWLDTGDIATMDAQGFVKIEDRAKDLVKSGGEWISSVDLENALMGHPAVAMAAVIGVAHPKWDERPLAVVVLKPGQSASKDELHAHLEPQFAKWWLPDHYEFVESIPIGSTGKFLKRELRIQFKDHQPLEG